MAGFEFEKLDLEGSFLINYYYVGDSRGSFAKTFEKDFYEKAGICFALNETFASVSGKNVLRGLHFQLNHPQAKLVCILKGRIWDVIVDLRPDSKTYKKWLGVELSAENHKAIFIPKGFAHGFVSLEDDTVMLYQCEGAYDKETDTGILFDASEIGIEWPINVEDVVQSERDKKLMTFVEYEKNPMRLI